MARIKLTIFLSGEAVGAVHSLAETRGITMTEVVRQAITTEKFLADAIADGDAIFLQCPDGTRRQIVLR